MDQDREDTEDIHCDPGHSFSIGWSPDSMDIYCVTDDGTVQVWDGMINQLTYHGHANPGWGKAVAWSPDSKHIAFTDGGNLQVWNIANMKQVRSFPTDYNSLPSLQWSPDGKYILFATTDHNQPGRVDRITVWKTA